MSVLSGLAGDIVSTLSDADVLQVVEEGAGNAPFMRVVSRHWIDSEADLDDLAEGVERLCRERAGSAVEEPGLDEVDEDAWGLVAEG